MSTSQYVQYPKAGSAGIASINADTSSAQLLSVGTSGADFAIVDAGSGSHVFNLPTASASNRGALSSSDWSTFNGKQAAGSYITALTGDITAAGPGSVAATLATVNSNVGSFGSSTAIPSFAVNGKGLITAVGTVAVVAPAGTLTGATLAANVVSSSLTSVGTIATGVWSGTAISAVKGGTAIDTSGSTGIPLITAGAWAVQATTGTGNVVRAAAPTLSGVVDVNGNLRVRIQGLTLTNGANNDVTKPTTGFARISGVTGAFSITGIVAGADGEMLTLYNPSGNNMTIANASGSSTAANRITTMTGADLVSSTIATVSMVYSTNDSSWLVTAWNA